MVFSASSSDGVRWEFSVGVLPHIWRIAFGNDVRAGRSFRIILCRSLDRRLERFEALQAFGWHVMGWDGSNSTLGCKNVTFSE